MKSVRELNDHLSNPRYTSHCSPQGHITHATPLFPIVGVVRVYPCMREGWCDICRKALCRHCKHLCQVQKADLRSQSSFWFLIRRSAKWGSKEKSQWRVGKRKKRWVCEMWLIEQGCWKTKFALLGDRWVKELSASWRSRRGLGGSNLWLELRWGPCRKRNCLFSVTDETAGLNNKLAFPHLWLLASYKRVHAGQFGWSTKRAGSN